MDKKSALVGVHASVPNSGSIYANAIIVKENKLTVWVSMPNGKIIKRHKGKHGVAIQ